MATDRTVVAQRAVGVAQFTLVGLGSGLLLGAGPYSWAVGGALAFVLVLLESLFFRSVGSRLPLLTQILLRLTIYAVIAGLAGLMIPFSLAIALVLVLALGLVVYLSLQRLLGAAWLHAFLGVQRRPRVETLALAFLDLKGSTTAAEVLGAQRFMDLLNAFFALVEVAALRQKAHVYKFVGDEVILYWKSRDAGRTAAFLATLDTLLERDRDVFLNRFGWTPEYRLGIHVGPVVSGTLGSFRVEMAFLGDTVNTAARIEQECRSLGVSVLLSSDAWSRLPTDEQAWFQPAVSVVLRGRSTPTELFARVAHPFES